MTAAVTGYVAERVLEAANAALYPPEMPAPRPETIARISRALAGNIDTLLIYARARHGQCRTGAEREHCRQVVRAAEAVRKRVAGDGLLSAVGHSQKLAGAALAFLEWRRHTSGSTPSSSSHGARRERPCEAALQVRRSHTPQQGHAPRLRRPFRLRGGGSVALRPSPPLSRLAVAGTSPGPSLPGPDGLKGRTVCPHQPSCPSAEAADREAAQVLASRPEQGWALLCGGALLFDDTGLLLPNGRIVPPHRPLDRLPPRQAPTENACSTATAHPVTVPRYPFLPDVGTSSPGRGGTTPATATAPPRGEPPVTTAPIAPKTTFLELEITGKCQLTCSHCYANSGPGTVGDRVVHCWSG